MTLLAKRFGKRISALRQRSQLSEEELANRAQLPLNTLKAIEAGEFSDEQLHFAWLRQIADGLDIHPAELII